VLSKKGFCDSAEAQDSRDRILYDRDTGIIRFDKDGDGAAKAVVIAKVGAGLDLSHTDFWII
jgi:hypothetical protein